MQIFFRGIPVIVGVDDGKKTSGLFLSIQKQEFIEFENVQGVVFLNGDMNHIRGSSRGIFWQRPTIKLPRLSII
jgi:hypothetical protein